MAGVQQVLQPHAPEDGGELPLADACLFQVDGLVFDPALLEVALGLLGVEALGFAEDLDVHGGVLL